MRHQASRFLTMRGERRGIGVREASFPQTRVASFVDALCAFATDTFWANQAREPRAAWMIGQMHHFGRNAAP